MAFSITDSFEVSNAVGTSSSDSSMYLWQKNNTSTYQYSEDRRATLFKVQHSWLYTFNVTLSQNQSWCKFWFGINANNILSEITPSQNATEHTISINVKAGDTVYIYPYLSWAAYSNINIKRYTYTYTSDVEIYKASNIVWHPLRDYLIWDLWVITIFWLKDNEFYLWETTNTVITGDVTLWNAVGFINIWGYKIPYYL